MGLVGMGWVGHMVRMPMKRNEKEGKVQTNPGQETRQDHAQAGIPLANSDSQRNAYAEQQGAKQAQIGPGVLQLVPAQGITQRPKQQARSENNQQAEGGRKNRLPFRM